MVDIEDKLEELAEGTGHDVDYIQAEYDEAYAEVAERVPDHYEEEKVENLALGQVRGGISANTSVPRDSEQTKIVTLGSRGFIQMGDDDEDVLVTYGAVDPADDSKPRQLGVILNEESTGADLYEIEGTFEPFNTIEAEYDVDQANDMNNTYVLHATSDTEPEVLDTDMSEEDTRQYVNNNFFEDQASLAEIGSHISQGGRDGWPDLFGADLKRITGTVVDWFVSEDGETGGYVVQDDSIIDPNDYPDEVVGDKRVPGITCWTDPEIMEYGESSVCDFYGSISTMDDGQVTMNVIGIAPIMANDIEFETSDEDTGTDEAEETTI